MKISRSAYLGVECLVRLVPYSEEEPCQAPNLARELDLSISHMESMISRLRAAGLVEGKRGPGGGYFLTRRPHRVTILEALQAFDEPDLPGWPSVGPEQAVEDLQGTELLWESLKGYIVLFLQGVSLADIAAQSSAPGGEDYADAAIATHLSIVSGAKH